MKLLYHYPMKGEGKKLFSHWMVIGYTATVLVVGMAYGGSMVFGSLVWR